MDYPVNQNLQEILNVLLLNLGERDKLFLVGGGVRDILLSQPIHDFDLVYSGDVRNYAIKVANSLSAAFFMLNDKYQTARIINRKTNANWKNIDIIQMRGKSIEEDLKLRDITINAMGIDIENFSKLIDPLSGASHLKQKMLVACSPNAFTEDPIRILRAIRQSISFGLRIEPKSLKYIKQDVPLLKDASPERIRDELFRNLDIKNPSISIKLLDYFGILDLLFPEIIEQKYIYLDSSKKTTTKWDQKVSIINKAVMLEKLLTGDFLNKGSENLRSSQVLVYLGRFRNDLIKLIGVHLHPDRSLRSLFYLTLLLCEHNYSSDNLMDINPPKLSNSQSFDKYARKLVLSNKERNFALKIVENHDQLHKLAYEKEDLTGGDVYQYFRFLGFAGILLCILTLAETLASTEGIFPEKQYLRELQISRTLLTGYFQKEDVWINPPQWIDGHDLTKIFIPKDKVLIGDWIERIRIATANGLLKDKIDAIRFVEENYSPSPND
ncbi:MAG: tRNA nucleotidyltransferase/poly(A) polymerase family protein [Anaerolineaceae bacterium]